MSFLFILFSNVVCFLIVIALAIGLFVCVCLLFAGVYWPMTSYVCLLIMGGSYLEWRDKKDSER